MSRRRRRRPVDHPPPLAEQSLDPTQPLRAFEVVEVVDGLGYLVEELGASAGPRWVADEEGSWTATAGDLFAGRFADDRAIRMPGHPDCPLCEAERERRMARAQRSRPM